MMDRHGQPPVRIPFVRGVVFLLAMVLILRALAIEPGIVPTGSMAPALLGVHKTAVCPRCGYPVTVGCRTDLPEAEARHLLSGASCPNCSCDELGLDQKSSSPGDAIVVDKMAYEFRQPRRWEMAVFRAPAEPGRLYVKRMIGLPGETVQIRNGDVYINGQLARKSLRQAQAMCLPVFDQTFLPGPEGWRRRWIADRAEAHAGQDAVLHLDATGTDRVHRLTYRHFSLDSGEAEPILDAYAYDAGDHEQQPVHDFLLEADVHVQAGAGCIEVMLYDGADRVTARLAVESGEPSVLLAGGCKHPIGITLLPGHRYHVTFAFVDRRASVAMDGHEVCEPIDLPPATDRVAVTQPLSLTAHGVAVEIHHLRLFRDVHYTDTGSNGTDQPVHLGADEYFVLGDNSPSSDDSRSWAQPAVPERNFLGRPFVVHWPF